tara:strand:- start:219 stop:434 length:216 start_codon:yes stop_codon:yes gene_type:complete
MIAGLGISKILCRLNWFGEIDMRVRFLYARNSLPMSILHAKNYRRPPNTKFIIHLTTSQSDGAILPSLIPP